MLASQAAEKLIEEIYLTFYFIVPRLPSRLSKKRLSESQFSALLILENGKKQCEKITPKKIEEKTTYSSPIITRILDNLGEKKLIERIPYSFSADKRKVEVKITSSGIEALSKEKDRRKKWFEEKLSTLSEKERTSFVTILRKIALGTD